MFLLGAYVKPLERDLQVPHAAGAEVSAWWHFPCRSMRRLLAAPVPPVGCSSVVLP